jgi:hypothetical protein
MYFVIPSSSASSRRAKEVPRLVQEAIRIKASAISWNRLKLVERVKMKLHFSNTHDEEYLRK